MTNHSSEAEQGALHTAIELSQIAHVAIVDDVFDEAEHMQLSPADRLELWGQIEFKKGVRDEITEVGLVLHQADDLTDECVNGLLEDISQFPLFYGVWQRTLVGQRHISGLDQVRILTNYLRQSFDLHVQTFASDAEPWDIVAHEPHLVFLDWQLGFGSHDDAVEAAAKKAQGILNQYPEGGKPKPLIVLFSSIDGMEASADDFCRKSGILRGMFYAVRKNVLTDSFNLQMYMNLFDISLTPGRRVQKFIDGLQSRFNDAGSRFLEGIRDLTLNDYAYIQNLSLQKEGQPLGDYLFSLFSSYLAQLVFSEALEDVRGELDTMTFKEALPSLDPPTERLTEVYHASIFDTNVGPVHVLDLTTNKQQPVLAMGDVLGRQVSENSDPHEEEQPGTGQELTKATRSTDLFLVITPQCDLEIRPAKGKEAQMEPKTGSILLLPGYLFPLDEKIPDRFKAHTELYKRGEKVYQIGWDVKDARAIPHGDFTKWASSKKLEREARLRQTFALDIQRSFAADLSRIGTPVMPPIYQPISVGLLRPNSSKTKYEAIGDSKEENASFLVRSRDGQQCVFTLPLITRLRQLLKEQNISVADSEWERLGKPFKLPTAAKPINFGDGRFKILLGVEAEEDCASSVALAVSLHVHDSTTI